MSFAKLTSLFFVLCLFLIKFGNLIENIIIEFILTKKTKKLNKKQNAKIKNNELPYFYGFENFGNIFGLFFGGRIIEKYGNRFSFKISLIAPVTLFFYLFFFDEPVVDPVLKTQMNFKENMQSIWRTIKGYHTDITLTLSFF
jgi:hypothetical protein